MKVLLAVVFALGTALAADGDPKIAPWLLSRLSATEDESFLVLFDGPETLDAAIGTVSGSKDPGQAVYKLLTQRAASSQAGVRAMLTKSGIPFRSLYIVNGLAVRGDLALARRLALDPGTVRIVGDPVVRGVDVDLLAPVEASPTAGPEWGVSKIEADKVWAQDGNHGEGIVVASADTGVSWTHVAIQSKYRGWNGASANHDFNWFDATTAATSAPVDPHSHGTHTTGTMVGDDGAGNQIGVAPGAQWIACRNMDAGGNGQPSTYIGCNQFFLAPFPQGGNPETDGDPSKAPNVVNNSWGCPPSEGCDVNSLRASFAALRAAGILAVAAAGNAGSSCSSVIDPPSIYDELFVVGATDVNNVLAGFSSRGPVTIDGSGRLRPDVAAPGVDVNSCIPSGGYGPKSGTSMASPHTAGAAALLWSAKPELRGLIGITRCVMSRSARSVLQLGVAQVCGGTGPGDKPNNFWGYGLIDAYDAIHFGPDGDGDAIPDACDCAPADGGSFDVPSDAGGLGFAPDKATLSWDAVASKFGVGTLYDVISGDLTVLRSTGTVGGASCVGPSGTAAARLDATVPLPDAGLYYLVQARNTCGSGGFGVDSNGNARAHANCP